MAETDQYSDAVDEYLARAYDGDRRRKLLEGGGWDADLMAELADLGWYALAVPETKGGLGAPLMALGPLFVQLGRHLVAGPMLENMLLPALLQRVDHLDDVPAIAAAVETGVPLALVDAGVSNDWSETLGAVTLSGQRLDGTVEAVRFARRANAFVVVADTVSGPVLCVADATEPGVRVEDVDSADPATEFARVVLNGVQVRRVNSAGPAGPADHELVTRLRSWARLLIACEMSGLAQHSLGRTVKYVRQREQFGRPIGSFQAVKHIVADMQARWSGLHNLCQAAVADADQACPADLDLIAATAKAHAARAAVQICEDAIQLHGGMGFTIESDVSWYYKRALALRGWYGDDTELHSRIGAALLARDPHPTVPTRTTPDDTGHGSDAVPTESARRT